MKAGLTAPSFLRIRYTRRGAWGVLLAPVGVVALVVGLALVRPALVGVRAAAVAEAVGVRETGALPALARAGQTRLVNGDAPDTPDTAGGAAAGWAPAGWWAEMERALPRGVVAAASWHGASAEAPEHTPPFTLVWSSVEGDPTYSVAWGDVDGDGDLDLAVGNDYHSNQLYRNDGGVLTSNAVWSSSEVNNTRSVAWGDVDGDGDLDLAVGNYAQPNRLYRNDGGVLTSSAVWSSVEWNSTNSVAWGDVDGDGDLDLAVGNYGQPNQLYRNDGGVLTSSTVWSSDELDSTYSVAWGDVDGDGDLDLAVGNCCGWPNRLYRNDGGVLTSSAVWSPVAGGFTSSVAWGDVDGDGDLDLAVGNYGDEPNQLYRNDGGVLTRSAVWSSVEISNTFSVAWGDADGDGDLDLAVGGCCGWPNRLYRNDGGVLTRSAVWSSVELDSTNSVAWGDVDGDGDLDLAVGNEGDWVWGEPNRLYRNDGSVLTSSMVWSSVEGGSTRSVAWGDVDGDGDLDLAVGGDDGQPNRLYRNEGGVLTSSAMWSSVEVDLTFSVAWGDVDGDGDLDLAVGNCCGSPNRLYRNDGGVLTRSAVWLSVEGDYTRSVAWGDVDGDGDLDLAVGNYSQPNRLYRNEGGVLTRSAVWSSVECCDTSSVAWGDVDGDGDLDLAVGNSGQYGQPNRLYHNDGGVLTSSAVWSSVEADYTQSVAWGDVDGDGDLDLAVGNYGQPNRLYRNDGGVLTSSAVWSSVEGDVTYSVAWGDVDGDGDLDLAVGNCCGSPNRLYRNDGGVLTSSAVWSPVAGGFTSSVAWGDVDGDGDLDLAVGNYWDEPNRLYLNNRISNLSHAQFPFARLMRPGSSDNANFYSAPQILTGNTVSLTYTLFGPANSRVRAVRGYYSLDGGGLWQPAIAAAGTVTTDLAVTQTATRGYVNTSRVPIPDMSTITATLLTTPTLDLVTDVDVSVNLTHTWDSNLVITLTGPLSRSVLLVNQRGGSGDDFTGTVFDDEAAQTIISGTAPFTGRYKPEQLLTAFDGLQANAPWILSVADTTKDDTGALLSWGITVTLNSGVVHTYTWDTFASGLFGQYDNVTFRIEAVPGGQLPGPFLYGRATADTFPFRVRGTQVRVLSGTLPVENALVYRWPAGQAGDGEPLADGSGQPLLTNNQGYLAGQSRLALGDRLVALWPVMSTRAYTLYYTSAAPTLGGLDPYTMTVPGVQTMTVSSAHPLMLFNLNVALEWDARNDAQFLTRLQFDLRRTSQFLFDWTNGQAALGSVTIYQDRAQWDDADVRVYATNRMRPMAAIGGIVSAATSDPVTSTLVYEPGMVHIGAVWNRYGDPSGELGEDWPRTLAHELGHYALFLDDDYLGLDDNGYLVGVETCASAMSDPYRDDYTEFHSAAQWQAECGQTLAQRTTGRWDWATVTTFYPWLDGTTDNVGPSSLPLNVTQISVVEPITPTQTLPDARFFLRDAGGSPLQPGVSARGYLFDGARMTALGRPVFDALTARGARPGARVCVFEPEAERLGCKTIQDGDNLQLTVRDLAGWQPDVLISPVTSRTVNLRVQNVAAGLSLRARLYAGTGPTSDVVTLTETSGVYSGTFALSAPTLDGYVQVWVEEGEPRREVLTQYALGGNPGHMRGGLGHMRGGLAPALSPDGQAILYASTVAFPRGEFFTLQAATYLPGVPSWASVAGHGYWLSASAGAPSLDGLHSLSFSYMGNEVAAGAEDWLRVYYWTGTQWVALETVLDTRENVAIARTRGAGLYALMASLEVPLYGPGWNQVAYYPGATQAVTQALASVAGSYGAVYGRVVTDTVSPWRVYAPSAPSWVNELQTLEFSHGYWISVTQDVVWRVHGPGDGVDVLSGGGAAPLTLQPPATYYGEVHAGVGFTPTVGMVVKAWINGVLCGQGVTQMQSGVVVYRVHVEAERAGYAGCGVRGRTVVFDVGAQRMATVASWSNELVWDLPLWADRYAVYLPVVVRNAAP